MEYIDEDFNEDLFNEDLERNKQLFSKKIQAFEEIPSLSLEQYETFLSPEFLVWYNDFMNTAIDFMSRRNFSFYENENKNDDTNMELLVAVLLNYFNDLNMPINSEIDPQGTTLNKRFYLKYQDVLLILVTSIGFVEFDYVFYTVCRSNATYCNDMQGYFVNFEMLRDYVLSIYDKRGR